MHACDARTDYKTLYARTHTALWIPNSFGGGERLAFGAGASEGGTRRTTAQVDFHECLRNQITWTPLGFEEYFGLQHWSLVTLPPLPP